ncbi:putative hydrolase of the HAD superfamily [Spinactinospora alkalitolerans]|uniref:Putative hydrolase of the HAD superfamily n=1 Tax=Spinactinospora alkalitolerans TaxID=687207 RepID=A0A852TZ73_9ACTN|nr:hypothetical protein [Spinactinospora alkalitolerans]NYE48607.1 putative hydrolase of the HAD superfamily [Spinactinospora alkalitolerans]
MTDQATGAVLVTLPDRDDAEELAEQLLAQGYEPCALHRDMLAGEDDAEDVDWVIEVRTGPHGGSAALDQPHLAALAESYDGFAAAD